jgi:putative hydrolase of HD superfamily
MRPSSRKSKSRIKSETRAALDFFAEAGLLKRVKRSGWWVAGIKDPESVADHCFRCAVIGFYMAIEEGADPYRVLAMTLFNDIHEARINDLHKMGHFYIDFKKAENKVFHDQVASLATKTRAALNDIRGDYDRQRSRESLIARDADILECLVQAKEYLDHGHKVASKFLRRAPGFLKTRTAKKLWKALQRWDSTVWWENVVKFER